MVKNKHMRASYWLHEF